MPDGRTTPATRIAERAMEFQDNLLDRARAEFGLPLGTEKVGHRELWGNIRKAVDGDPVAFGKLIELAQFLGHQPGDGCALCQHVDMIIAQRQRKERPQQEAQDATP